MNRIPLDQAKYEAEYQILNRKVETELFEQKLIDMRKLLITTEGKDEVDSINNSIQEIQSALLGMKLDIEYFEKKLDILDWPIFRDKKA